MKKVLLAVCLMGNAAFASFADVQINFGWATGAFGHESMALSFTFTSDGSYGIAFGERFDADEWRQWDSVPTIDAFGYYFLSDPTTLIAASFTGNNSDYFASVYDFEYLVDTDTGFLGNFNAGDTIGVWALMDGMIETSTDIGLGISPYFVTLIDWVSWPEVNPGYFGLGNSMMGPYMQVIEMANPSGQPLPGVIAALAIGGCAFLGRKLRNRVKK